MNTVNKSTLEKIDKYITDNKEVIINDLLRVVSIPSVESAPLSDAPFGRECKNVLEQTKKLYEKNGFKTTISGDNKYALSYFGDAGKTIGLFSHGDVVPVSDNWKICKPFEPIVKDGYVFGRGCNDDKSGIIEALYAAKIIRDLKMPFKSRLMIMTGSNEETGMADIISFAKKEKMPDVSLVLDGEYPYYGGEMSSLKLDIISKNQLKVIKKITGGKVYNIVLGEVEAQLDFLPELYNELQKKCENNAAFTLKTDENNIFIFVKGKSGHTANIDKTQNALVLLCDFLVKIKNIPQNERDVLDEISHFIGNGHGTGFNIKHSDKDFGELICSNGFVRTENNMLVLGFDIRAGVSFDTEEIKKRIVTATNINWNVEFKRVSPGYLIDNGKIASKAISAVYAQITGDTAKTPVLTSGGTYSRALSNAYSIGTVDYNLAKPVLLPEGHGGVHQPDEKISIDGLLGALKILVCLLLELDKL